MFLIYGANGYTGELVARTAASRGVKPVLAARREEAVAPLAKELGLEYRVFSLDSADAVARGLAGATCVLHCAGPFSRTAKAMSDGCLRAKVHYLDVTGEIPVYELLAARDEEAKSAGVMLLPGTGFDIVPSDCLAAHLKRRLPSATHLALGFQALGTISHGTATTMLESIDQGGAVRRGGKIVPVPAGHRTRSIDFGRGPVKAATIPWGDVSTAFHSTGIPDVEVYMAMPGALALFLKSTRVLGPLLGRRPVRGLLQKAIDRAPRGPTPEQRARGASLLWGEATDDHGGRVVSRLRAPETYALTAEAALAIAERVDRGEAKAGFQTPSRLFGPDFVLSLPGVSREDVA